MPIYELYISILLLSFTGLFAKLLPWDPITIIFWRTVIAGISFLLILSLLRRPLKISSRNDILIIGTLGAFMVLHWVFYYWAVQISSVAIGMISIYSYPVISALIEPLAMKERFQVSDLIAALERVL
mgnify:CR=1 FL=1